MGFLKGGVTFRRFAVNGPKPKLFGAEHLDRLREFRAGGSRPPGADGVDLGWAAGGHIFDTDFTELKNVYPDHLLFDLRVLTNRLPADRLKAYYETELKALSKDNPSGFPSARQKREAREAARERLGREAKDGRYLKHALRPVAWDAVRNEVLLGSTSAADADRLTGLFVPTFEANLFRGEGLAERLRPVSAGTIAVAHTAQAKHERLSAFVQGVTPDEPGWCPADNVPDFLGNEFLLWLWFHAEQEGDALKLPDGSEATFMFSGGLRMECPRGQTGNDTMNHENASRLPEAKVAARGGKLPRKAALTVVRHDEQFSFVLNAETLAVTAGKVPKPDAGATGRAQDEGRLQHVRDLAEVVEQMYLAFLGRRLSSYWSGELAGMQGWLKAKKGQAA